MNKLPPPPITFVDAQGQLTMDARVWLEALAAYLRDIEARLP